jgi:carbamoyl-phosphate synthase large subunit
MKAILVTGSGGDIGYSIGKLLLKERLASHVIGSDVRAIHAGISLFHHCITLPSAHEPRYVEVLATATDQLGIDIVIPTSEPELRRLLSEGLPTKIGNASVLTANSRAVAVGLDKYKTNAVLGAAGIPVPWTVPVSEGDPPDLPCILKPRRGSGSISVVLVESLNDARFFAKGREDHVWQQFLPGEEFTCGLFRSSTGEVRTLSLRRKLRGDVTGEAEVVADLSIEVLLRRVASALDLVGSINVQLRLTEDGPFVFEINPRFSSTVLFRHLLGFKDVLWCLEDLSGVVSQYIPPQRGTRIFRVFDEVVLTENTMSTYETK